MLRNDVWESAMYVVSPLDVIPIRRNAQSREQRKLQMIMGVHESGQDQEPAEVDRYAIRFGTGQTGRGAQYAGDAVANDLDCGTRRFPGSEGASSSANYKLVLPVRFQLPTLHNECSSCSA
jgi:hypothetical protein